MTNRHCSVKHGYPQMEKHDDCKKAKDQDSLTENDSDLQLHLADLMAVISPIIVEIRVHVGVSFQLTK